VSPLLPQPRPAGAAAMIDAGQRPDPEAVARVVGLRLAAHVAAVVVAAAGVVVLLGWALDLDLLKRLATAEGPVKPSSGVAFVLSGAALWLLAHGDMHPRLRIAAAAAVSAIGVLTLSDYVFGFDAVASLTVASWDPGRMSPNAAAAFLLAGGSLALGRVRLGRFWAADVLGFAAGCIGLVALVGHAVAAPAYYRVGGFAVLSVPSAVCFVLLGGGILLSVPKRGASRLLVSDGPGGALVRWLLPVALFTPLLVGLVRWQGQVAGLWEGQAGMLLLLLSSMTAMAVITWFYARSLDRADAERRAAESVTRRLAALVDSSDDAIVSGDLDATVLTWNRGAEHLFGYTVEEAVGSHGGLLLSPERRDEVPALLDQIRRGEAVDDFQTVCLRKDGTRVDVEMTLSPIRDGAGEVTGISSIARDVTERRRADERERLQAEIALNIEEGVCLVRASDRELLWANARFHEVFGYAGDALKGRSLAILEPADLTLEETGSAERVVERLEREGRAEYDVRSVREDGREIWCHVRASAYDHPEHGRVWLAIQDDVTEARRLERERGEALTELERSNAELEQYASVASHDLGEPLRVVSGFVQLLQRRYEGRLDEDADRFIAATVNGVDRMQAIIDALLAYSRVGRAEVAREQVDVARIAHGAITALQAQIDETRAEVRVRELPIVRGDDVLLGQVLQNLISNAVKFRDGPDPVVEITAELGRGEWVIAVADNGAGIDPRNATRVFEMFQRGHGSERPGIGIGLAMCKRIVQKHGGRIWAESRAAGGTVMRFSVPDRPALR
jgi:PAS domain S-box-containing protein